MLLKFHELRCLLLLLSLLCHLSYGEVRLDARSCRWNEVTGVNSSHFKAIFYSYGCDYSKNHVLVRNNIYSQDVHFVFVEAGGDWSDSSGHFSSSPEELERGKIRSGVSELPANMPPIYGLNSGDTWKYRRIYAELSNFNCDFSAKWKCFVSGSVRAHWVDTGVYSMSLVLPVGHSYLVSVLAGIDSCTTPLESLGQADVEACPSDSSVPCGTRCGHIPRGPHNTTVLEQFSVDLRSIPQLDLQDAEHPINASHVDACRLHDLRGAFVDGSWISPLACPMGPPFPNNPQADGTKSVCIVGDSHMARSEQILKETAARARLRLTFEGNYLHNKSIHVPLPGCCWHPKTLSLSGSMMQCLKGRNANTNAIVWWFGSHAPFLSPAEVADSVKQVHDFVESKRLSHCVVVVGILDTQFENAPPEYAGHILFRNSWRIAAQNEAMRDAVVRAGGKFHFIDLFQQSLAVHFDGHHEDPIHFTQRFYEYVAHVIMSEVVLKC